MTIKYTLVIEGTEKELEVPKKLKLQDHLMRFGQICHNYDGSKFTYQGSAAIEYKVVEPLKAETTAVIDDYGFVNVVVGDSRFKAHAGKKVKVTIIEEE